LLKSLKGFEVSEDNKLSLFILNKISPNTVVVGVGAINKSSSPIFELEKYKGCR
jgi:hypothetical protein